MDGLPYAYTDGIGKSLNACGYSHGEDTIYALEMNGPHYRAKDVSYSLTADTCQISMDLADAYPDSGIHAYRRTAVLEKGDRIVIRDVYSGIRRPVVLSLMTYEKPFWDGNDSTLWIGDGLGSCRIEGAGEVCVEAIPIEDDRLKGAWEHEIYRTLVVWDGDGIALVIE